MESCTAKLVQKGFRDPTASGFAAGGELASAIVSRLFLGIWKGSKVGWFVCGGFQSGWLKIVSSYGMAAIWCYTETEASPRGTVVSMEDSPPTGSVLRCCCTC
jgi:hypothetical protein